MIWMFRAYCEAGSFSGIERHQIRIMSTNAFMLSFECRHSLSSFVLYLIPAGVCDRTPA
jgi:hypothetical protein